MGGVAPRERPAARAGSCRLADPTVTELAGIRLEPTSPCSASPCIDPTFGPTVAGGYWSSTSFATLPVNAYAMSFGLGTFFVSDKGFPLYVRAVRNGL